MAVTTTRSSGSPRGLSDKVLPWALRIGAFALFALWWQLTTQNLNSLLLPTFLNTMAATWDLVVGGAIWEPLWLSNQALIVGYLASVIVGVPLGLAMSRMGRGEAFVDPYINLLVTTPMAALIPLFVMAMGLGLASRSAIVFVFAVVNIVVNTRAGVRGVDRTLIEMARSYGATEMQTWRRVLMPGAAPALLAGLRIGLGRALTGMVLAELLMVGVGVGRLILKYRGFFDGDYMYGVVLLVVAEALILMQAMRYMEQRFVPWANDASRD